MTKFIRFLLLIILSASMLMTAACGAKKKTKSEFIYEISEGEVTITGYSGLDSHIDIPSKIDGYPVTKIAENSFKGLVGLKSVTIPDSVNIIDLAFSECPELKTVKLGSGITSMNGAFKNCPILQDVSGGENAVELSEAFMNCEALTSGKLPKSAVSCVSTFRGCKALETVEIEEGVTDLPYTFEGCISLKDVALPSTVIRAISTFENCTSLTAVSGCESLKELENTFKGCVALTSLDLGNDITLLSGAFIDCKSLTKIENLPSEVGTYSASFSGCSSLSEIIIPKVSEGYHASYSFADDVSGCTAIEKLAVYSDFLVTGEFCKTFSGCSVLKELVIPDKAAEAWLRVDSVYNDSLYKGTNSTVKKAVNTCKKASNIRITYDYGFIDEKSYTYIFGGDVGIFSPENVAAETSVIGFNSFTRSYYWCGYPSGTNRKTTTVAIERTYTFYLRVTGGNDGTLPSTVIVNGMSSVIEDS